jgi:hypothetical protein
VNETKKLEEAIALALQLTPTERLRLVEYVVASVEREMTTSVPSEKHHWGEHLSALIDSLDLSEWSDIDDPVEWVRQQREAETKRLQAYWDGSE